MNETCNCATQTSGRDFVKKIEYLRNVYPVVEAGEQARKTITHARKEIISTVITIVGIAWISSIGKRIVDSYIVKKDTEKKKKVIVD